MKYLFLTCLFLIIPFSLSAQSATRDFPLKKAMGIKNQESMIVEIKKQCRIENGNVAFVQIIDELPLTASEIYKSAVEYINDSYRITKYELVQDSPDKGFVIGKGELGSFEKYASFPNQYVFSCSPYLRMDAKDGKCRVSVYLKDYAIIRTNGNIREEIVSNLADVSPMNPNNDDREKMYNKAFVSLSGIVLKIMEEISEHLRSVQSSDVGDW